MRAPPRFVIGNSYFFTKIAAIRDKCVTFVVVMRATPEYVKRRFEEFNAQMFGGLLPPLPIMMSNAARALGLFVHPRHWPAGKPRGAGECHIRISTRLDLPEQEVEDTIIHEMIHYHIWYHNIADTGPHGPAFRSKMMEINRLHGRNITICHKSSDEVQATDRHHRNNYICVQYWRNGGLSLTVCARTAIFDVYRYFSAHPDVERMEWYWSMESWFNRYPQSRTPKAYRLTQDELQKHFATATPCICDGQRFAPKPRH